MPVSNTVLRGAVFTLLTCALGLAACSDSTEPTKQVVNIDTTISGNGGVQSGQLSIWTNYAGQIAVSVDGGSAGTTTDTFTNPPSCGAPGTVTRTLNPGTHAISGASGNQIWTGSVSVSAGQCTMYKLEAPQPPPPQTGQISVWTNYTSPIAVAIDGSAAGTLTTYYPTGQPTCGQAGMVTVAVPAGTHVVNGLSGQLTWSGNVNVIAGQCTLYELNAPVGGGGTTGQISVWTDYPDQIAVRIDGSSVGTLTSYFSNGAPTCGQAGTLTLTVPAGTHAISGVSGSVTWSGTATVVAGQCTLFRLDAPGGGSGGNSGRISIWTNYPYQVAVSVDGASVGTTTTYFPNGSPTCAQAGTITVSAGAGVHDVSARSGQVTWNGNVTVIAGECTLYELRAP